MKTVKIKFAKLFVFGWLFLVLGIVGYTFWKNELKYNLPTPIPKNYTEIAKGSTPDLSKLMMTTPGKPMLIHFFNPKCPCSRFNIRHFKSLVKKYGSEFNFAIVALTEDKSEDAAAIKEEFDLDLPIYFNEDIAKRCGVISTPQAVILNDNGQLFYRGNYNKSRYCTDTKSDYARMAIDSLLTQKHSPTFNAQAHIAYGCPLPSTTKCIIAKQ